MAQQPNREPRVSLTRLTEDELRSLQSVQPARPTASMDELVIRRECMAAIAESRRSVQTRHASARIRGKFFFL